MATSAASSIGSSSAVLNGRVDPNRRPTTYFFEYGTTTSYGTKTSSSGAGSGSNATNVSKTVSGLTAGTTYHFRLVATSDAGTVAGSDQSFTTQSPPTVATGQATAVGPTSATLGGTCQPQRALDDVVRRVRDEHVLRLPDLVGERRLRDVRARRQRHRVEPATGSHLSLPGRRDELARDEPGRGCHVRNDRRARGGDRSCHVHDADAHVGARQRHRQPTRPHDDVVVRVRPHTGLRVPDGRAHARRVDRCGRRRQAWRAHTRSALALSPRRAQLGRNQRRRGRLVRDAATPARPVGPPRPLHDRRHAGRRCPPRHPRPRRDLRAGRERRHPRRQGQRQDLRWPGRGHDQRRGRHRHPAGRAGQRHVPGARWEARRRRRRERQRSGRRRPEARSPRLGRAPPLRRRSQPDRTASESVSRRSRRVRSRAPAPPLGGPTRASGRACGTRGSPRRRSRGG